MDCPDVACNRTKRAHRGDLCAGRVLGVLHDHRNTGLVQVLKISRALHVVACGRGREGQRHCAQHNRGATGKTGPGFHVKLRERNHPSPWCPVPCHPFGKGQETSVSSGTTGPMGHARPPWQETAPIAEDVIPRLRQRAPEPKTVVFSRTCGKTQAVCQTVVCAHANLLQPLCLAVLLFGVVTKDLLSVTSGSARPL